MRFSRTFPRPVMRWRLEVLLVVCVVVCVLLLLRGFYRRELYHFAGGAQWMWVSDDVRLRRPTAGLFYRRVELGDRPARAVAKVCGDQQFVLWVNGQPAVAGRNRPDFLLDVVPVTDLLTAGENLIVVEARSPTSVGAVLFALDLYPTAEGRRVGDPRGRNVIVSDGSWKVLTEWRGGPGNPETGGARRPWIWGRPPDHPWTYPRPVVHERPLVQTVVSESVAIAPAQFRQEGENRWVHDLGRHASGYLWLGVGPSTPDELAVTVCSRGASARADLEPVPVVRLQGQDRWLFPGLVDGEEVVISGSSPPENLRFVEALGSAIR